MSPRVEKIAYGWRPVIDPRSPNEFAAWLRATRGCSGVYLLRSAVSGLVGGRPATKGDLLYVGESHRDTLYGTLTRHFQVNGQRRYERDRVEARVIILDADRAVAEEARQIRRHAPRDNTRRPVVPFSNRVLEHAVIPDGDRSIVVVVITEKRR
jgi:hypothetical protein